MFPNRLVTKRGNKYSHVSLSRLLMKSNEYIISFIIPEAKRDSNFMIKQEVLLQLQENLEERLGTKALGCVSIIRRYQRNEINTLQFVDMLEKELGRVTGEIYLTDKELGLILAGTAGFIKDILSRLQTPTHRAYTPNYKFSKEVLNQFRDFLLEIFGYRAKNCFDMLKRYELLNPGLKEYSKQQYTIKKPKFFHNIENKPDASYWFGFLRADGSLNNDVYSIKFELAIKDKRSLEDFAKAVGFPLSRIKPRTRFHWYKGNLRGYESAILEFKCKPMAKQIDKIGFQGSKADQKYVPDYVVQAIKKAKEMSKQANLDWWLTTPGKVALAFLLGYYDGDGTYIGGRSARITSGSKPFLEHIKE